MPEGTQRFPESSASPVHLAPGVLLDGKYEIVREIARGGMGVVYLARQVGLAREVAIKVVAPALVADADFVRRFRREALTLARLRHAHIVSVHDFVESAEASFLVLDYLPGGDLEAYFQQLRGEGRGLPIEEAARLIEQLLSGLVHAHAAGIVHRDLKPANLLLDSSHDLHIADFGLAQLRSIPAGGSSNIPAEFMPAEATQTVAGTIDFMAPEVRQGSMGDARSDVFAVGVIAYWLICGERPSALSPAPSRHKSRPAIAVGWDHWMAKSLAPKVADRFASAQDMLAALRALRGSRAPQVRRGDLGRGAELKRDPLLGRLVLVLLGLGAVAIALGGIKAWSLWM